MNKRIDKSKYLELNDLKVYQLSRKLSLFAWKIYSSLTWQNNKVIGDQFVSAVDSVGANIAEGYGRFHYLDRIRFYYNARGSLLESNHWFELIIERKITIEVTDITLFRDIYFDLGRVLNGLIQSVYKQKNINTIS